MKTMIRFLNHPAVGFVREGPCLAPGEPVGRGQYSGWGFLPKHEPMMSAAEYQEKLMQAWRSKEGDGTRRGGHTFKVPPLRYRGES